MQKLPIHQVMPDIINSLREYDCLILQAEPGAGKTTQVPLALLDQPYIDGKILLLEPRRIAARSAAQFMAQMLGETVGERIGYTMRNDQRTSRKTQIEVITEGVLVRRLLNDPLLEDVAMVIFDEFHERSIHTDLGIALCRDVALLRDEPLKLLVMSATVDTRALSNKLGDAPIINCSGRGFPVDIVRTDQPVKRFDLLQSITRRCLQLCSAPGDVLIFLPGKSEIHALERLLNDQLDPQINAGTEPYIQHQKQCQIIKVYSGTDESHLESLFSPSVEGSKRFILATSIAQTSITLPYVNCVIDSGLERKPQFDIRTGITRLTTKRISHATATQRAGRAGRVQSGLCYQLWTEQQNQALIAYDTPEIGQIDLSDTALTTLDWGIKSPDSLEWIDPPPHNLWQAALQKLEALGAIETLVEPDPIPSITTLGKELARLPTELRVARLLINARNLDAIELGTSIAALISEPSRSNDCDLASFFNSSQRPMLNQQQLKLAQRFRQLINNPSIKCLEYSGDTDQALINLVLSSYGDRVAISTDTASGRFKLKNGTAVRLDPSDRLSRHPFIVCIDLGGRDDRRELNLRLGLGVEKSHILHFLANQIVHSERFEWEGEHLRALSVITLGEIEIDRKPARSLSKSSRATAWCQRISREGLDVLPHWTSIKPWLARLRFLYNSPERINSLELINSPDRKDSLELINSPERTDSPERIECPERLKSQAQAPKEETNDINNRIERPDLSDKALLDGLEAWLAPALGEIKNREQLRDVSLRPLILSLLPWQTSQWLDQYAPEYLQAASGRLLKIDYQSEIPSVSVKLQEMFGLTKTPTTGFGQPIRIELLSPAGRPVALTTDLEHFWNKTYPEVRKELRGRYAKHPWPEDPFTAVPSHLTNAALRRLE